MRGGGAEAIEVAMVGSAWEGGEEDMSAQKASVDELAENKTVH
jgi:hypothetical protein